MSSFLASSFVFLTSRAKFRASGQSRIGMQVKPSEQPKNYVLNIKSSASLGKLINLEYENLEKLNLELISDLIGMRGRGGGCVCWGRGHDYRGC